uniref:Putative secreted protein n=1 Tax=Xenopsylla cheopis TaxID=163159 RepID=A0A6M2DZ91_XENCH
MFLATILALILGSVYFHANKVQKRTCSGHPGVTCDPNCPAHFDKTNPGLFNKSSARCYPDGSPAGKSPTQEINLGNQSPMGGSRFNSSLIGSDTSPVYGDATYYPSPEARRNRRFI